MGKLYEYTEPLPAFSFVEDLCRPMHEHMPPGWGKRRAESGALDLTPGFALWTDFPDPRGRLDTAYKDFNRFLTAAGLQNGSILLRVMYEPTEVPETHTLCVAPEGVTLSAGDTEGIRRGLVWLEDEICRYGGPGLSFGTLTRRPVVRTRISRCFYGPIKRPPFNRDELADDVDYYPDGYLNRLAHDGTNGLWLTVSLRELIPSRVVPEFQPDSAKKLEKLRRTVAQCLRYGIKIYAFMIEPAQLRADEPAAVNNPDIRGLRTGGQYAFCTSSEQGKAYLREAFSELFRLVPGLGGVIDITVGERLTHCWSVYNRANRPSDWAGEECPRCRDLEPARVLRENLEIMENAIHAVDPEAELISWPYSQRGIWGEEDTVASAGLTPSGVCHCFNFESGGREQQLGKTRYAGDYWLSYVGPSGLYRRIAANMENAPGTRLFAKLQVGCSHEVATVPFVPVPSKLYEKYRAMHELGVSGALQCWYFGSYPSPMTKAAGELSFAPFPASEEEFLLRLAGIRWGENTSRVVLAWKRFAEGYSHYPLNDVMGYYGPMHDGPGWPLYLEPANRPLSPSWRLTYSTSGDRIGESFYYTHSLEEILYLTGRMEQLCNEGAAIMESLTAACGDDPDCAGDIRVCRALGLQFRSAHNIFRFYALREDMAFGVNVDRLAHLRLMRDIVLGEREISAALCALCLQDGRLGFHSEAEGYKYHPDKLRWRIAQLDTLLAEDFPALEARLLAGQAPFPEYEGQSPEYKNYAAPRRVYGSGVWETVPPARDFQRAEDAAADTSTAWQACWDGENLYVRIVCQGGGPADMAELRMEPRSLWWYPATKVWRDGRWRAVDKVHHDNYYGLTQADLTRQVTVGEIPGGWACVVTVPLKAIRRGEQPMPLRINIVRRCPDAPDVPPPPPKTGGDVYQYTGEGPGGCYKWVRKEPIRPQYPRLIYGAQNTQEWGYLLFADGE